MPVKLVAMMRVKNEERWIEEVVRSVQAVAEQVFIMDDSSTDNTVEICRSLGAIVLPSLFTGLDESRDKTWLLRQVDAYVPDWVLCTDGDEILDKASIPMLQNSIAEGHHRAFSFRILYLWGNRSTIRTDGVYGRFWRPSLFHWYPNLLFKSTGSGGNFHCGNIPSPLGGSILRIPVNILHLGYMDREDRIRKFKWYSEADPDNQAEGCYMHMIQGDVDEIPADMKLQHAGPLKLETLC